MEKKKTYLQEKQVHVQTKSVIRIKINSWKVSNLCKKNTNGKEAFENNIPRDESENIINVKLVIKRMTMLFINGFYKMGMLCPVIQSVESEKFCYINLVIQI